MAKLRRPLSRGALAAIIVGGIFGGMLLLVVPYVLTYTIQSPQDRFDGGSAGASCTLSGASITLTYLVASSKWSSSEDELMRVRPESSSGLVYTKVEVTPHLAIRVKNDASSGPKDTFVRVDEGSTVVLTFRESARKGRVDGLRVDWSRGETGGYQVLPLRLTTTPSSCSVSSEPR